MEVCGARCYVLLSCVVLLDVPHVFRRITQYSYVHLVPPRVEPENKSHTIAKRLRHIASVGQFIRKHEIRLWLAISRAFLLMSSCHHRFFSSPQEATKAEPEKLLYVVCLYVGTKNEQQPDYSATIDVDPSSPTYSTVVSRTPVPYVGDELHHFGWNTCCSSPQKDTLARRYLIAGGQRSGRIYIFDTADEKHPKIHHIIEPEQLKSKVNLGAPHTVHCLPNGNIMISMLGDSETNNPGGFLLLDQQFQILGHWEKDMKGVDFNYDFWYQPRYNIMVSTEWAAPKTYFQGFHMEDVKNGKYGKKLHFWDWKEQKLVQSIDLGEDGWLPLEVRFHHNPDSCHGYVGAALSSNIFHIFQSSNGTNEWKAEKVISVPPVVPENDSTPVPAVITDILISMDDRFLYFSDWLHGDVRQYDISEPSKPRLTGQLWLGGLLGKTCKVGDHTLCGGPQMLQLSLDGTRLYVTNSLFSSWDNQFYPEIADRGSYLVKVICNTEQGGMELDHSFFVDFGKEPGGPCRAHEVRYPGGDCTSDIWI